MKHLNLLSRLLRCKFCKEKEENQNNDSKTSKKYFLQFAATICVCILTTMNGSSINWTSAALPFLKSENSEIPVSESEGSWIASILDIGMIIGDLILPFMSTIMGRKLCLLILALPQIFSWIMIIFAKNVIILYISRFIAGVVNSIALGFAAMYIGEIADKKVRGILLLILTISIRIGSLAVKTAGAFLSYQMMNISMLCFPLLFFITFIFMPESPYYLLLKNRKEEALKRLMKLQGTKNPEIINSDFAIVQNAVEESQKSKNCAFKDLVFIKKNRKSLYIVITSFFTMYLSGLSAIAAYTQEIFNYSRISLAPEYCTMILAGISVMTTAISTQIIEHAGRRRIFLLSGIFSAIGLGMVGLFFFQKSYLLGDIASITWLPLVGLIIYEVAFSFGIGSIPFVLMGEMFDINVKETAIFVVNIVGDFSMFLIKIIFQWVNDLFGIYTNFWIYTICCIIGTLVFFLIAPETKGKSLEDIQDILNGKNVNTKDEN